MALFRPRLEDFQHGLYVQDRLIVDFGRCPPERVREQEIVCGLVVKPLDDPDRGPYIEPRQLCFQPLAGPVGDPGAASSPAAGNRTTTAGFTAWTR